MLIMPTPLRADCWVADTVGDRTEDVEVEKPRKGWSPQAADLNEGYFFLPSEAFFPVRRRNWFLLGGHFMEKNDRSN